MTENLISQLHFSILPPHSPYFVTWSVILTSSAKRQIQI